MGRVKVGYIIGSLRRGGTETHLAELLPVFKQGGLEVSVFVTGPTGPVAEQLEANNIPIFSGPMPHDIGNSLKWIRRLVRAAVLAPRLYLFAIRHRRGLMHVLLPEAVIMCGVLLWPWRQRLVIGQRGLLTYRAKYPHFVTKLERFAFANAALIVANSQAVANELIADGVPPQKVTVIYNGLGGKRLSPSGVDRELMRQKLGLARGCLAIVTVGNLFGYKGHADLIDALATLVQRNALPPDWRLLVIGRDEPVGAADADAGHAGAASSRLAMLKERAARLGVASNVVFLGERDDVPELLRAVDIGVHPSHEEGFSNAVIEYMAAGLGMVATTAGGTAEALDQGRAGMLVPPHAPQAMADAIKWLVTDVAQRQALGARARERALTHYGVEACAGNYEALYRRLLSLESKTA